MHGGKSRCDLDRADRVGGLQRPHRHHQRPVERPRRRGRHIGAIHRHRRAVADVAELDAVLHQRVLERKRAAEREDDEIVAPVLVDVGRLVDQFAVPEHLVAAEVGADVEVAAERGQARVARIAGGKQRAGLRIELAEAHEIGGERRRQDGEIALHIARREPRCRPGPLAAADRPACIFSGQRNVGVLTGGRGHRRTSNVIRSYHRRRAVAHRLGGAARRSAPAPAGLLARLGHCV